MDLEFKFFDKNDEQVLMSISSDEEYTSICDIGIEYHRKEGVDGVEFSVSEIGELDDIISALQYIRDRHIAEVERNEPIEKDYGYCYKKG